MVGEDILSTPIDPGEDESRRPEQMKSPSRRPPPSAAAKARVAALLRGGAPVVKDPEEARGLAFVSPAERQAAANRAARKRALKKRAKSRPPS
jgi:hypothetical protein